MTHPEDSASISPKVKELLDRSNAYILPVYARPPIVLAKGKGAYVWDVEGRQYLDFSAGIAVNALGHGDEGVVEVSAINCGWACGNYRGFPTFNSQPVSRSFTACLVGMCIECQGPCLTRLLIIMDRTTATATETVRERSAAYTL